MTAPRAHRIPRLAWLLLGVILGLRVGYALAVDPQEVDFGDAPEYRTLAASALRGDGFCFQPGVPTLKREPLFPLLLAGLRLTTGGEALRLAVILNALLLTVATWFTARIAADRAGWGAGLGALVVAGASPYAFYLEARLFTEPLFLACLAPSLWLLQRAFDGHAAEGDDRRGRRAALAGGALLGLAALTRGLALYLTPVVLAWAWVGRGSDLGEGRRERLRRGALAVGACLLVFAPWGARNLHHAGRVLPLQGTVLFGAHNPLVVEEPKWAGTWVSPPAVLAAHPDLAPPPGLSEVEQERHYRAQALAWTRANPGLLPWLTWRKAVWYWELFARDPLQDAPLKDLLKALGYKLFLPFLVLGALVERRRRRPPGIYLVLGAFVLVGLLTYGSGRMRAPAGPVWMAVAGVGLASAGRRLRRKLLS